MNDRLVTALGALAALLVLGALLFQGGQPPAATRPVTPETGPNGYAALALWLEREGVPVQSLRTRLDRLDGEELGVPATGNLLITTMPHQTRIRYDEVSVLWSWIAGGNSLLVLAALDDTPDWSQDVSTLLFRGDLQRITGLTFTVLEGDADRHRIGSFGETSAVRLESVSGHPLMRGVESIEGVTDSRATLWQAARAEDPGLPVLQLARETASGAAAVWEVRLGEGHVIVSALGSALTNRVIGRADNRSFVANLLAHHLAPGGAVIFDDMHQGLTTLYDPGAFYSDPRLGATVLFVLGFWALYVVGSSNRLSAPTQAPALPSQGDFVAALGGFLARKLARAEAGRLMLESWFDELRRRGTLPATQDPPWQALSALAAVDGQRLIRLRRYHEALRRDEKVDLRTVHNLIEELRRMLK